MPALSAITGLGVSALSREDIGSTRDLAIEAVRAAVYDADLKMADIDGLLLCKSPSATIDNLPLHLRNDLAMGPLGLLCNVEGEGTSVMQSLHYATLAIRQGMARRVVCVFSDARIQAGGTSNAYAKPMVLSGIPDWESMHGVYGALGAYAFNAREYMDTFALNGQAFGHYAIACRRWALLNPAAFAHEDLTMDQYLDSRFIVEPLRLLDCALPVNGAAAVVVEAASRAGINGHAAVCLHGIGQGHSTEDGQGMSNPHDGARTAASTAIAMAGIGLDEITQLQAYDPFSSVGLQLLEAYGFCRKGQAAAFVESGATSPGGRLPMNTGGGHLSGFYLQGMTPVIEAVQQLRGIAQGRQCPIGPVLVGGLGGCFEYNATVILCGREVS
jgi:acetyl-CoA acetyltransferase